MMAVGKVANFVIQTVSDITVLGRWSWILVGTRVKKLRIVVVYVPRKSKQETIGSFYYYHQCYFDRIHSNDRCPL